MKGTAFALIAVILFSTYASFGKILLTAVDPFVMLLLREILAAVILLIVLDLIKKIWKITKRPGKEMRRIFVFSIISGVFAPLLFLMGLNLTTATNAILISRSEVVFTSLLAVLFLKEKVSAQQIAGAIIMFAGIAAIATNGFAKTLVLNIGDVFILLAALSFASSLILLKKYLSQTPPEVIVALRNLFGGLMLLAASLYFVDYSTAFLFINTQFILILLVVVVFGTIFAQYFWYKALETTSVTNVALVGLAYPLFAIFFAVIILGESLDSSHLLGIALVLAGLLLMEVHFRSVLHPERYLRRLKLKHWPHI